MVELLEGLGVPPPCLLGWLLISDPPAEDADGGQQVLGRLFAATSLCGPSQEGMEEGNSRTFSVEVLLAQCG